MPASKRVTRMTDYILAWQCIGCGKIEAPQTCIGVCRDRKVFVVGKEEHERALAANLALQARLERVHAGLLRFGQAEAKPGQWESAWHALQAQVREVLATLADSDGGTPPA